MWTRRDAVASFLFGALVLVVGCGKTSEPKRPAAARLGLDPQGNLRVSEGDRCPMCAMDAFAHRSWAGAVELDDGTTWYTCSVRCAFGTALKCEQFLGVTPQRIRRVRVPNYMHPERSIDANTALYVIDSDIRGPMGLALVPAASKEDVDVIVKRHGGRVLQRADITIEVLMDLKKRSKAPQPGSS